MAFKLHLNKANIHHQTMNRSFHYAKKKKVSGWKHRPAWNITFPFLVPKFAWNALDFLSKSFKIIEWSLYSPYQVIKLTITNFLQTWKFGKLTVARSEQEPCLAFSRPLAQGAIHCYSGLWGHAFSCFSRIFFCRISPIFYFNFKNRA